MARRLTGASELERYVDGRELARQMGVSPTTVKRWTVAGMPSYTWGMKRMRRYLPSESIAWARARQEVRLTSDLPDGDRKPPAGQPQPKE